MPLRVQLRRTKGWRLPENTVVVARPTRWGNPFRTTKHGAAIAVTLYRCWLEQPEQSRLVAAIQRDLGGKNLACWCRPGDWCHADILLEIANRMDGAV